MTVFVGVAGVLLFDKFRNQQSESAVYKSIGRNFLLLKLALKSSTRFGFDWAKKTFASQSHKSLKTHFN